MSVVTQWPAQRVSQSVSWGGIQVGECERHGQTKRRWLMLVVGSLLPVGLQHAMSNEIEYTVCKSGLARTLPTIGATAR